MSNKLIRIACPLLIAIAGCSSDSDEAQNPSLKTGVFIDSAVANVSYTTATQAGTTNTEGEFSYLDGELVTFSIGALEFPAVQATEVITPIVLASATSITDQQATNIARLLQSLDNDGDPANGIVIPPGASDIATAIDFTLNTASFESDPAITNLVANSGSSNTTLITETAAQAHVTSTLDSLYGPITGVWRWTSGEAFSYLVLFADNTFLYAENDLTVESAAENGLEAGTYTYGPFTHKLSFDVVYDDNAPGTGSGIGDIGTPSVIDTVLSNNNDTLTIAGGELVLSAANFIGNSAIVGAWRLDNGEAFNYLLLFADNTFLYAENYLTVESAAENGLEVGTYSYDSNSGNITFTVNYDDNAPGDGSGIGDIGNPSVIDAVLSNSNNTLTIASGALTFTREL